MAIEIIMPKLDTDQETGTVMEWLKTEGQQVKEGEIILVIETDKIAIDVESPGKGVLAGISAKPGEVIPTGRVIAYLLAEGEKVPEDAYQPVADAAVGDLPPGQVPLTSIRRRIAARLDASYRSIPHIQFSGGVDMTNFNKARKDYNDLAIPGEDARVTITALLVKLVAMTLADHPWLNSSLQDEEIILHEDINIGLAVALETGLIVPVIKNADKKGIGVISTDTSDLIARAREGTLVSADVKGSTFTISNLGPFGVEQFNAIINPPEVAVLAIGAILPAVVSPAGDEIAVRPWMRFTLSADHRVVDGAVAARFLADLKRILEDPPVLDV